MAAGDDELKLKYIRNKGITACPPMPIDVRKIGAEFAAKGYGGSIPWHNGHAPGIAEINEFLEEHGI